jgi:hypothetical protein
MKKPQYNRAFDYDKKLLPNTYIECLEENVTCIDEAIPKSGHTIGYPGWNLIYYAVLCCLRKDAFNNVIETGTNLGCSTIILAQALKDSQLDGCVYTVEIDKMNYEKANDNIKNAGVADFVKLYNRDSLSFLAKVSLENDLIAFAFLDGCHDQDNVVKEFELIYPYLDHKSFVAFDNTYLLSEDEENNKVNGALKIIKRKYGGNLINFENVSWFTPGLAFWQKDPFLKDWAPNNKK